MVVTAQWGNVAGGQHCATDRVDAARHDEAQDGPTEVVAQQVLRLGHPGLEHSRPEFLARSLWSTHSFPCSPCSWALENLPPFDQKKDSKLPFRSWRSCAEPGIALGTSWLRAIWKTINLQGCTKHPEAERRLELLNPFFPSTSKIISWP